MQKEKEKKKNNQAIKYRSHYLNQVIKCRSHYLNQAIKYSTGTL